MVTKRKRANPDHLRRILKERTPRLFDPPFHLSDQDYISPPKAKLSILDGAMDALNARSAAKALGKGHESKSGDGWMTHCPCHNDSNPSLSLRDGSKGSIRYRCFAGCSQSELRNELNRRGLLSRPNVFHGGEWFDYTDESGNPIMSVQRVNESNGIKSFRQYHIDNEGHRKPGIKDRIENPPVFNLPLIKDAIRKGIQVFIVEGEKHAMQLRAEGIAATTNNGGAGKWRDYHSDQMVGAKVVILPDNDEPGKRHAEKVANSLKGKAKEIRILELPGLPEKGDVIDYLHQEGDYDEHIRNLKAMAEKAPIFKPTLSDDKASIIGQLACPSTAFLSKKVKKPQVLLRPLLRDQSLTMIYAKAGVGKSFLIHSIAIAVTRKNYEDLTIGPWTVRQPCGVLLVDGELPVGDLQDRLNNLIRPMGPENPDHPLRIITAEEIAIHYNQQLNLTSPEWREAIAQYLAEHPELNLVILDNISSLVPGVNENDKKDWDPINQWLLSLRRSGRSVIMIHHANKKGTDRGHSGRLDNLDNVLVLDDEGTTDQVKFKVSYQKARYLKPGEGKPFTMELVEGDNGLIWATGEYREGRDSLRNVVRHLSVEGATQMRVSEELGISQSRVSQLRRQAKELGYLTEQNRLTPEGEGFIQE